MINPLATIRDMWSLWREPTPCRICGKKFYPARLFDGMCSECVYDKLGGDGDEFLRRKP